METLTNNIILPIFVAVVSGVLVIYLKEFLPKASINPAINFSKNFFEVVSFIILINLSIEFISISVCFAQLFLAFQCGDVCIEPFIQIFNQRDLLGHISSIIAIFVYIALAFTVKIPEVKRLIILYVIVMITGQALLFLSLDTSNLVTLLNNSESFSEASGSLVKIISLFSSPYFVILFTLKIYLVIKIIYLISTEIRYRSLLLYFYLKLIGLIIPIGFISDVIGILSLPYLCYFFQKEKDNSV